MKRFLTLFIAIAAIALSASAEQIKQSIIIDTNTIRQVQTDALTGAVLDKIQPDTSRRPCARIKILFHKMTKEQMSELEALTPSDVIDITKTKVADYENVLILEMTARPNTKFYLRHPKFGTSNEVVINLEGDKEYQAEATLNKQLTINIASNVAGADVYLNNEFKGTTAAPNNICTIADVFQGKYSLRLEYGERKSTSDIEVIDGSNIYFRLDIDDTAPVYQYLIINTKPKSALVEIDGKSIQRKSGKIEELVTKGVHHYTVSAADYYPLSDTVVLDGSKTRTIEVALKPAFGFLNVEHSQELNGAEVYVDSRMRGTLPLSKPITIKSGTAAVRVVKSMYHDYNTTVTISDDQTTTLTASLAPNFSTVTITADSGVEIWIDGQKRGTGKWVGNLEIGKHLIDCRKEAHEEAHHLLNVTNIEPMSVDYGSLTPIYGALSVKCNISGAKYSIDGIEQQDALPYVNQKMLIGTHSIKIYAPGYNTHTQTVTIEKGKIASIDATLTEKRTSSYKTGTTTSTGGYTATSSSSSTTKTKQTKGHFLQFGLGFEFGFGSNVSTLGVPVELRIGRVDQLINGIIGINYTHGSTKIDKGSVEVDVNENTLSPMAKLRLNTKRSNSSALFIEAGAMYNILHSAKYKTNFIDTDTESYANGWQSESEYKIDSKPALVGVASIGYSIGLIELSLYATYNFTNPYSGVDPSSYIVSHSWNGAPTTLNDYECSQKFLANNYTIGMALKIYFGSGLMKR